MKPTLLWNRSNIWKWPILRNLLGKFMGAPISSGVNVCSIRLQITIKEVGNKLSASPIFNRNYKKDFTVNVAAFI
ncbi:hypothetical protein SY85_23140 [Flavisolibacter tropicus]|uniref:Uncharacterized protein n=1 Tax=Flavisolibacter tropicus TaxID=1492898 RepID=A0A172U0Q3_9BACT|nr:hypothetical protein SY85_23140 [Flavisolibacter tropicus]